MHGLDEDRDWNPTERFDRNNLPLIVLEKSESLTRSLQCVVDAIVDQSEFLASAYIHYTDAINGSCYESMSASGESKTGENVAG